MTERIEPNTWEIQASFKSRANTALARAIFSKISWGTYDRHSAHRWALKLIASNPTDGVAVAVNLMNFTWMEAGARDRYRTDQRYRRNMDAVASIFTEWKRSAAGVDASDPATPAGAFGKVPAINQAAAEAALKYIRLAAQDEAAAISFAMRFENDADPKTYDEYLALVDRAYTMSIWLSWIGLTRPPTSPPPNPQRRECRHYGEPQCRSSS